MKRFGMSIAAIMMVAAFILSAAGISDAQRKNDREVRDALRSLNSKIDDFDYDLTYQLRSSSASHDDVSQVSDDIRALKGSVRDFQKNLDQRRENGVDVSRIIDSARPIGDFLKTNPQNRQIDDNWNAIRGQIERLGANYGITPNWEAEQNSQGVVDDSQPVQNNPVQNSTVTVGLSGTYSLDIGKSETVDDAIGNVELSADQRDDLKEKLQPPAQIAVDIRGSQVTLATTNSSPVTFFADGRDKTEPDGKGGSIHLRAKLNGQTLTVSSITGDTDYTITLNSDDNGRTLKVTRRITTDYLSQTIFAESIYDKSDSVAGLGINSGGTDNGNVAGSNSGGNPTTTDPNGGYSDNDQGMTPTNGGSPQSGGNPPNGGTSQNRGNPTYGGTPRIATNRTGDFVVPNGVILTGTLDNEINTKASQNNDRFRLIVQSPDEFRGATIDGYISGVARSGKVTGRSAITFNFEKITLSNGKTYDFAGFLQSIRDTNGKDLRVDAEGTIKGDNQGTQTAKRGAVGAGLGALIGVIAGGGRGAAIGAIIGGGAGAGSVAIQGRDDLQLQRGSTITLQSSSPIKPNQSQDR